MSDLRTKLTRIEQQLARAIQHGWPNIPDLDAGDIAHKHIAAAIVEAKRASTTLAELEKAPWE